MARYTYGVGVTNLTDNLLNKDIIKMKSIHEAKKVEKFINDNFQDSGKKVTLVRFDK